MNSQDFRRYMAVQMRYMGFISRRDGIGPLLAISRYALHFREIYWRKHNFIGC